jgi:hypothetical protein
MEPWELYAQPSGQPDQKQPEPWELYAPAASEAAPSRDPYSTLSTVGRVATNAGAGMVDLSGGAINAVAGLAEKAGIATPTEPTTVEVSPGVTRTFNGRVPSLAEGLRSTMGIPELPPEASNARRLAEAGMTGLVTGGRSILDAVRSAPSAGQAAIDVAKAAGRTAVLPTAGAEVGSRIGEKVGGDEGRFFGSVIGGAAAGNLPRLATRGMEQYYGAQARPDAADIAARAAQEGVTPTAGMLGNEKIQSAERQMAGARGSSGVISDARERALVQMREAADRAASNRGATDPSPTPGTIGQTIVDTADQTGQNLRQRSSDVQQAMYDRVGNAPVNVAQTYAALRSQIGSTDPITARPMQARLDALEQMMPRDKTGRVVIGPGGEINVPLGAFKDWRGGLGRQSQTLEAVPGGHLDQIYGPATDAMREAAISQGVSPAEFDMTQGVTRGLIGSGGPVNYFEKISGKEGTSGGQVGGMTPEGAFSHVVKGGEQNPQRLQQFEQHADPKAVAQIAGDTLRQRAQSTLGAGGSGGTGAPVEGIRGGGAAGARNFANWWENMTPEARRILGGNQQPTMENLAELAGAFNYPTRQTGLTRAVGGQTEGLGARIVGSEVLANIAQHMGLPSYVGRGLGMFGVIPASRYLHARAMESDTARRGMTGQRTPVAPNMDDLIAALNAANVVSQRRSP